MMHRQRSLGFAGLVVATGLTAALVGAAPKEEAHASVQLFADTSAVVAAKPFTVALHFKIADGWHLYHRESGDSGEPPRVKWTLPEGFTAGPLRFPPAEQYKTSLGTDNVYHKEVALLVTITPPASLDASKPVKLDGVVRWLACDANTCLPERGSVSLELPVGTAAAPANEEQFKKWKSLAEPDSPTTAPAK
jgi:thiol:disulfide interchange protein DsbD